MLVNNQASPLPDEGDDHYDGMDYEGGNTQEQDSNYMIDPNTWQAFDPNQPKHPIIGILKQGLGMG